VVASAGLTKIGPRPGNARHAVWLHLQRICSQTAFLRVRSRPLRPKPCSACICRFFAGGRTSPAASARVPFCCICSALCSKIPPHRFTLERER